MAETHSPVRGSVPWKVILLGAASLALALFIGTQVIGILYSIIAPPAPPLPEGAALLEHSSSDYGVDDWLYGVSQNACDVARFYQEHDTDCHVTVENCGGETGGAAEFDEPNTMTQCTGEKPFSIFAMRWDVIILPGQQEDGLTHFRLLREVFWTGSVPPKPQLQP